MRTKNKKMKSVKVELIRNKMKKYVALSALVWMLIDTEE